MVRLGILLGHCECRHAMSPFLFILVVDVLGRIIDLAKEKDAIKRFVVGRDRIGVTHLQFVDDTIFFFINGGQGWQFGNAFENL